MVDPLMPREPIDPVEAFRSDLMAVVEKWQISLSPLVLTQAMHDVASRVGIPFAPLPVATEPPQTEPPPL